MMIASNAAKVDLTQEKISAGNLGDADIADAGSRLAMAQRAVEASIAAAQKTFSLTSLNALK